MVVLPRSFLMSLLWLTLLGFRQAGAQSGSIAGRVTVAQSGLPISDVQVEALAGGNAVAAAVVTNAEGSYRIGGLQPGTYAVRVRTIGYQAQRLNGVRVVRDTTVVLDFSLVTAAVILNPTIVSANLRPERLLEAPASVSQVPGEQFVEQPTITPAEQARSEPGVQVATTGIMQTSIVTRGFNNVFSGALLTLTDHRYASVPSLRVNANYLVPIVAEDVDRMEIVLGPGAALYGPNSANGVMHIFSRSPFEARGTTLSVGGGARSASTGTDESIGDRGIFRGSFRHASTFGDRLGIKLSGSYLSGKDWVFLDSVEVQRRRVVQDSVSGAGGDPDTVRIGARDFDVRRYTAELRADYRIAENTALVLAAGRAAALSAIEMTGIGAAQARNWLYDYYQARLNRGRLFAQVFLNASSTGDAADTTRPGEFTYVLRNGQAIVDQSRMLVGQVQHGFNVGAPLGTDGPARATLTYGIDYQRTEPRTEGTITGRNEDDDLINEIGGYLHSHNRLSPRFDLVLAGRLDHHSRIADPVFSPRAALVFRPVEGQNFRLTFNRAFSTPTSNNLFLDLVAQKLHPQLPYDVRTLGVPEGGFQFSRDCASTLCMRSPFAPDPRAPLPSDASGVWIPIVRFLAARGIDISTIRPPTAGEVNTVLRILSRETGQFSITQPDAVDDIGQLRPTISSVVEAGYKGLVADRVLLAADVYWERRTDFVGPLVVETPNVFVDPTSFATYLISQGVSPASAQAMAAAVGPVPLGTISPDHPLGRSPDLVLTYRNYGEIDLWGADVAVEALLTDEFSLSGTYSHVNKDRFPEASLGADTVALNAPRNHGSVAARYRSQAWGLTTELRGRFVSAFPMNSGVYKGTVEAYNLVDLSVAYRLPFSPRSLFSVNVLNLLDDKHREFIGAPEIGRLIFAQMQYTF